MEIWQLKCFMAVADTMSFSRAAETLYVTQPAISQQIRDLESQLGVELFARSKQKTCLTTDGELFYREAQSLIQLHDRLVTMMTSTTRNQVGTLRIGFESHLVSYRNIRTRVTRALSELLKENPGITLQTKTMDGMELVKMLQENRLDVLFVTRDNRKKPPQFSSYVLSPADELYLVYHPDKDTAGLDAAGIILKKGIIAPERDQNGLELTYQCLNHLGVKPEIQFCTGQMDNVIAVELGLRAAIIPKSGLFIYNSDQTAAIRIDTPPLMIEMLYNSSIITPALAQFLGKMKNAN